MAPKQDPADTAKTDVALLCNILMAVPELKLDNKSLATILGLSSPKNVLRSLNGRLKPYGFEYKSGKFIQIGQEPGEASTASSSAGDGEASNPAAAAAATETDKPKAATKTAKTPKAAKPAKAATTTKKAPASKKRKVEEAVEQEEEDNAVEAEAKADADAAFDADVKDEGKDSNMEE